jgi:nucleoside 2-deoxyribosyltransferase
MDAIEGNRTPFKNRLYLVSSITRQRTENKLKPLRITEDMLCEEEEFQANILTAVPIDVQSKIDILLQYIGKKSKFPSDPVEISPSNDYPIAFCNGMQEFKLYIKHLLKRNLLHDNGGSPSLFWLSLTIPGWIEISNMSKPNLDSKQAFVAMWFDDTMDDIFENGIKPIEKSTGFNMFRIDKTQFIDEKICDKIIIEIKKSRFLIIDVTGQRQAVYFEAGYAMGMGLPVIWTCKESDEKECCFDTRQYNHIFWKDAEDLRTQLKERILATIGKAM